MKPIDSVSEFTKQFPCFLVYDLETTGGKREVDRILEVGVIRFKMVDGEMQQNGHQNFYIRPEFAIPEKITELTGITIPFIMQYPYEDEIFDKIHQYFGNYPVVGYNSDTFDNRFLSEMYSRNKATFSPSGTLDLLPIARSRYSKLKSHKLGDMARYLKVDGGIKFHNGLADALVTARIMKSFLNAGF